MVRKKRGLNKKEKNFFRRNLVLDSVKSKIAFFVIVLLFLLIFFGLWKVSIIGFNVFDGEKQGGDLEVRGRALFLKEKDLAEKKSSGITGNSVFDWLDKLFKSDADKLSTTTPPVTCTNEPWATYGYNERRTSATGACIPGALHEVWNYTPEISGTFLSLDAILIAQTDALFFLYAPAQHSGYNLMDKISFTGQKIWTNSLLGHDLWFSQWPTIVGDHLINNGHKLNDIDPVSGVKFEAVPYIFGTWGDIIGDTTAGRFYTTGGIFGEGFAQIYVGAYDLTSASALWKQNHVNGSSYYGLTDRLKGALVLDSGILFYAPLYGWMLFANTLNTGPTPYPSGIYALDPATGVRLWSVETRPTTKMSAGGGRLYLVEDNNLVARSELNGVLLWSQPVTGYPTSTQVIEGLTGSDNLWNPWWPGQAPVVAGSLVIIATNEGVNAYNSSTGALAWAAPIANMSAPFRSPSSVSVGQIEYTNLAAALGSDTLVATAPDGIHVISLSTGAEIWRGKLTSAKYRLRNPIIVGNRVYVIDSRASLIFTPGGINNQTIIALEADPIATTIYTISTSAGKGGTISPAGNSVSVEPGSSLSINIIPWSGYKIASVVVDGVNHGEITNYTFNNIMVNHTISASFSPTATTYYTLSITNAGDALGTVIKKPDLTSYPAGTIVSLSAIYDNRYPFAGWSGDLTGNFRETTIMMNSDKSVVATFNPAEHRVSASAGTGGTITPTGDTIVKLGSSKTFNITPLSGYKILDVLVDTVSKGPLSTYTFNDSSHYNWYPFMQSYQTYHTIAAKFIPTSSTAYTITAHAGSGGRMTPSGSVSVAQGTSQTFTITPWSFHNGNYIVSVVVDGVDQGPITSYTFSNVMSNHAISVNFIYNSSFPIVIINRHTGGGTVTPNGIVSVTPGGSQTFTITPWSGFKIASIFAGPAFYQDPTTNYNVTNIEIKQAFVVEFIPISPNTSTNNPPNVFAGSDQTITLPSSASLNATVTDDGLPNPPGTLTTNWNKVSGPGTVTFGNATAVDTTADFSTSGTYILRLTASDSSLLSNGDVNITVNQQCDSGADTDGNGIVTKEELDIYIQQYYQGNVNIDILSNAITEHLNGCG